MYFLPLFYVIVNTFETTHFSIVTCEPQVFSLSVSIVTRPKLTVRREGIVVQSSAHQRLLWSPLGLIRGVFVDLYLFDKWSNSGRAGNFPPWLRRAVCGLRVLPLCKSHLQTDVHISSLRLTYTSAYLKGRRYTVCYLNICNIL